MYISICSYLFIYLFIYSLFLGVHHNTYSSISVILCLLSVNFVYVDVGKIVNIDFVSLQESLIVQ